MDDNKEEVLLGHLREANRLLTNAVSRSPSNSLYNEIVEFRAVLRSLVEHSKKHKFEALAFQATKDEEEWYDKEYTGNGSPAKTPQRRAGTLFDRALMAFRSALD